MSLRLRHLRLRAITNAGPYGADVSFSDGLTILWADNTKGKSTCMQGMLYALGLERMLSPRRDVPLPHAMTAFLRTDDNQTHDVLESHVALEIENGAGQVITVRRAVKSEQDRRLITVEFGPTLSSEGVEARRQNFFVLDPGAASREDGFHYFLEQFLGWRLPIVRRYDMPDTKLYLETIFPLFWVEQKAGWSSIPAAIPTYFRIREVQKRAVEFILDLDVHKLELRRQQLDELFAANAREWRVQWEEADAFARRFGAKSEGLPNRPTANLDDFAGAHLVVATRSSWISMQETLGGLRARVAELANSEVPQVEDASGALTAELESLSNAIDELNAIRIGEYRARQIKVADIGSLERRVQTLQDDLLKNQDVQRLQRYSGSSQDLSPERCPTCEQALVDTLLSQEAAAAVMPIEDNIEYIKSQSRMFGDILAREREELKNADQRLGAMDRQLAEMFTRVRAIRSDLVSPGSSPSAALIEERVRAQARIEELERVQSSFDEAVDKIRLLSTTYQALLAERAGLPQDKMSDRDRGKLTSLTDLLREQANYYGFSTFAPGELSISEDSYRPQKEGFEIGFEISASDAIRLKWAYQLSLLEVASEHPTNHPGVLLFDEPRQQEAAKVSFANLLRRAAGSKRKSQQVVFSTSEDLGTLQSLLAEIDCNAHIFEGYIIQPLGSDARA